VATHLYTFPFRESATQNSTEKRRRGYDLFGSIALIDAEPSAAKRMAKKLMDSNRNIKTVLRKGGPLTGTYRTRKFIFVGGARNYLAEYKENGCAFRFDVRKVFFSPRLSYERKRVSELVRDGENVMVMFAGVGPFAIEIAKKHKKCKVVAIELNRAACIYMKENIKLNKASGVVCEVGDVNRFVSKYGGFADRIVMPLPKDSPSFLPAAIKMAKKRCTIHLYHFCPQEKVEETIRKMKSLIESRGASVIGVSHRNVVPYSSSEVEIVMDFRVSIKKL
jgi:tRNA (guanine37-N1)-methyltransferase